MKKLLLPAALALAVTAFASSPPAAFAHKYFGLFTCHGCCKCDTFCVRPYNAFSPVACGNITFGPLNTYPPGCDHGFGFGDEGCLSVNFHGIPCASQDLPAEGEAVAQEDAGPAIGQASAPPVARPVSLTGPARMPVGPQQPPQPYNPYAAGYHPAYYPPAQPYYVPAYAPAAVPAYWHGQ